jgi:hypothetical protein
MKGNNNDAWTCYIFSRRAAYTFKNIRMKRVSILTKLIIFGAFADTSKLLARGGFDTVNFERFVDIKYQM